MILICYDGSDDAQAAIQHGGELMKGQSATVLTVWQLVAEMRGRTAFVFLPSLLDAEEIDQANAVHALRQAEEGTELAEGGIGRRGVIVLADEHHGRSDSVCSREAQRQRDPDGVSRPHRSEVTSPRQCVARSYPTCRPSGDRSAVTDRCTLLHSHAPSCK